MMLALDVILGHNSVHSFETGPVTAAEPLKQSIETIAK